METKMHNLPLRLFRNLRRGASPMTASNSSPEFAEATARELQNPQSSLRNLAANNPHVIAASLFTRKSR
jgi:hypothetical protein